MPYTCFLCSLSVFSVPLTTIKLKEVIGCEKYVEQNTQNTRQVASVLISVLNQPLHRAIIKVGYFPDLLSIIDHINCFCWCIQSVILLCPVRWRDTQTGCLLLTYSSIDSQLHLTTDTLRCFLYVLTCTDATLGILSNPYSADSLLSVPLFSLPAWCYETRSTST